MAQPQREQRFARHLDGSIWDANEVPESIKDGPWFCAEQGCPLRYDRVISPYRRSRSGAEHTVNGFFRAARGGLHDLRISHHAVPQAQTTLRVADRSRNHISRVVGLQGPEPVPRDTAARDTGLTRTEYEYGPELAGLRALVRTAREFEANPEPFRERRFRVAGSSTEYFWNELWTPPQRDAYRRTHQRMQSQFSADGGAYFVEGFARDRFQIVDGEHWIKLRVDTDFLSEREEIQLHLPNTSENRQHLFGIQWQTPLAIWSHRIYRVGQYVLLKAPDWRHVLADGSEGMVTIPRLPAEPAEPG